MPQPQRESWKEAEAELFRLLVENVKDYAIFVVDRHRHVLSWSKGAERLLGFTEEEIIGQQCDSFFTPEDARSGVPEKELEQALQTGRGEDDRWHMRKDGSRFWCSGVVTPLRDDGGNLRGFAKIMRDRTDLKRAEEGMQRVARRRDARLAVTQILAEADDVAEATPAILRTICESLDWDVGALWELDRQSNVLRCVDVLRCGPVRAEEFVAATRCATFPSDKSLPGRVWHSARPLWIADVLIDPHFLRAAAAAQGGLHGAFACPIRLNDDFLGVIEFFSEEIREPDPDLLEMMTTLAGQIGQFMERKRAEEQLRRSERELADFFENASVGLHWVGPDGTILRVNRAELDMLGYAREEYVGHHIAEFHADPGVICDILRRLTAGETLHDYEARLRCKDGTLKYGLISSNVLWEGGQFIHTRCLTRDVTERKRVEDRLRESEARLQAVLDHTPAIVYLVDHEGRLLFINRRWREAFGLTNEQVAGRPLHDFFPPDIADQFVRNNRQVLEIGTSSEFEETVTQDGMRRTFISVKVPFSYGAYSTPVICGISTDITERKRAEEALLDADRRKDEFLATLAHELRNPLAPIRNSLQILKMPRVDAVTVQQTRDMMERQVNHLVRLVDDLLDVSRVMRGKIELRREPVELASVVVRAVETAQPLIEVQGHRLEISVPPESLLLDADPVRLAQVVGNLLTNAAKYTEANGRIWITAERVGGHAVLTVRDAGIGIAPEMLPHVFDLFVQVDYAATRSQGGLGIGLTLVKNLVEMHDGTVEARSEGLGKGCEFVVRLPLAVEERREPQNSPFEEPQQEPARASGHRLMVVDDNKDAALSLATLLRLQGHSVRVAHDGSSALELAESYRPAMIFLDIGMPGMDGFEVARRLRQQPGLDNVVLVALTGWGQQEDRRRTAEAGFNHHLVKPPEPKALKGLIAELNGEMG